MGILSKLRRAGPPDVTDMHLRDDVAGLERALAYDSSDVVRDAAQAIAALHRHGDAGTQAGTLVTGESLIAALAQWRASADEAYASWALIDALGEIGYRRAGPALIALLDDPTADEYQRMHAARALGRIGDRSALAPLSRLLREPRIDRPVFLPSNIEELAGAAASALGALGAPGVAVLAEEAAGGRSARQALDGLREAAASEGPGQEAARAALERIDAASAAAADAERERLKAEAKAAHEQRAERFPQAASLAAALGHPEWLTDAGVLRPQIHYDEALDACRAMGVSLEEHEEDIDNGMTDTWATVQWEGGTVVIDRGRGPREVLH